ncbi:MAG: peptidase M3, partial [Bacteroidales bacterium]|nr:peptidase M3 [Bacteroidales bacterium]
MKKLIVMVSVAAALCACTESNPLLSKWDAPFGIPPFGQVEIEHYKPALLKAMEVHDQEIDAIVNNPTEPDFENTIVALDVAGELLGNVQGVFSSEQSINSSDELSAVAKELSPIMSEHSTSIMLNEKLFERVKAVYDKRETLGLDEYQMRLVEETYKRYVRSGACLAPEQKEELRQINTKIAALHLQFSQNLLKETAAWTLTIDNKDDLAGLSEDFIADAAARAAKAGQEGKWIVGLDNPSVMPFLASADNRDLRIKVLDAYLNRCNNNNENDNKEIIKQILALKLRNAQLMGYDNYADFVLSDRMAGNKEAVYELLDNVWEACLKSAAQELADIETEAAKDGIDAVVAADWRYYQEKAKAAKFNVSEEDTKPYFQIDNVREGIFYVANRLYGITFTPLENVPVPHPEALAFECKDKDGSHLGVIFMDMFARPGQKRG